MKEKVTLAISIGCVSLILTMIIFTQFKTVDETDITAIETMRETELRAELASWKNKYEEVDAKISETETKISEYKQELNNDENSSKILEQEVKDAEKQLGYTNVKGEGVIVTLSDNDSYNIESVDLLDLVNELNSAGAEAISINDERIVSMTEITTVELRIILVNTRKLSGPYIVKAIGDKKYLESALNIKGGYIDRLKNDGKTIEYGTDDNIVIPAFEGEQTTKYIKENKEG